MKQYASSALPDLPSSPLEEVIMLLSPALALSVLTQVNLHCNEFEIFPYTVASYIHYIVANSLGILTVCFL